MLLEKTSHPQLVPAGKRNAPPIPTLSPTLAGLNRIIKMRRLRWRKCQRSYGASRRRCRVVRVSAVDLGPPHDAGLGHVPPHPHGTCFSKSAELRSLGARTDVDMSRSRRFESCRSPSSRFFGRSGRPLLRADRRTFVEDRRHMKLIGPARRPRPCSPGLCSSSPAAAGAASA
jgi:hypothetical protein